MAVRNDRHFSFSILPGNNPVSFTPNSSDVFTSLQLVPRDKDSSAFWKMFNIAIAAIMIVAGVMVSGCNIGGGISMIAGGAISLCSQLISDKIGRIGGGVGSIIAGIVSLAGGYSGIPAVIMGILGVSSIALGVNEIATGITGENYIQSLTGMSDEMYVAIYVGVTIANALGNAFFAQCFAEGTLVKTEEGDKKIEEIQVGDKVLAYDEETGKQEYKKVLRLFRNESQTSTTLNLDCESEPIVCTPEHPFFILNAIADTSTVNFKDCEEKEVHSIGCWVAAKNLKVGHKCLLSDGKIAIITKTVTKECETFKTYNFEVADLHNYYVGELGVLVHNACRNPDLDFKSGKSFLMNTVEQWDLRQQMTI